MVWKGEVVEGGGGVYDGIQLYMLIMSNYWLFSMINVLHFLTNNFIFNKNILDKFIYMYVLVNLLWYDDDFLQ